MIPKLVAAVLVCALAGSTDVWAQDAARAAAKAAADAAAALLKQSATTQEAGALGKVAHDAATKAGALLDKLAALPSGAAALDEGVKKAVAGLVDPATAASAAARTTADAAQPLAGKIPSGEAQSLAALAAVKAGQSAAAAAKALEEFTKQKAAFDKTTDEAAARKTLTAIVSQATAVAEAATAVALASTEVGKQATAPDQPVLTDEDRVTLQALRGRITGGAIFFNGPPSIVINAQEQTATVVSNQFGQASMYLALEMQPTLIAFKDSIERGYSRWYVEPFLDLRLTAIPVTGAAPIGRIEAPDATFLQSQKAVQVQGGGVFSWNFGEFTVSGARFHWGWAPMVRVGFQSVTDSSRALRVWNFQDDLYHNVTGGFRLALYRGPAKAGFAPARDWTPTAHFEVSLGQFQNFETAVGKTDKAKECLANPARCLVTGLPPKDDFEVTSQKDRVYVEARLALNYLYLGLDINNGSGKDDLRIIAGLTVDVQRFFRRN